MHYQQYPISVQDKDNTNTTVPLSICLSPYTKINAIPTPLSLSVFVCCSPSLSLSLCLCLSPSLSVSVSLPPSPSPYSLPQVCLDLNLPPQLMLHICLLQLRLEQHLESHDELADPLPCQIHSAKLSLTQWPANLKVI